jgi:hypothetical protein
MMKKLLSLLLVICFFAAGCKKEAASSDDGWVESIPGGSYFAMGNTLRLYYIDGSNKSIIDPAKVETLPYTYLNGQKPSVVKTPEDYNGNGGAYNGNVNFIVFDPEEKLYYGATHLQGDKSKHNYTFYISCAGEIDKFDVQYSYQQGGGIGGDGVAVRADAIRLNGVLVADNSNMQDRKIFITKANGKTQVSTKR